MITNWRGRRRPQRWSATLRRRAAALGRRASAPGGRQPDATADTRLGLRTPSATHDPAPSPAPTGRVNMPSGMLVASEWSWRLLLVLAAAAVFAFLLVQLSVVVVPVLIAALVSALLVPVTGWFARLGVPRGLAAGLTMFGLVLLILGMLALVGQQVATGYEGLYDQVVQGFDEIRRWLIRGPLGLSPTEIDHTYQSLGKFFTTNQLTEGALRLGTTVGHVVAGLFLALFTTYFMLYEGERIWTFMVRLLPRTARSRADSAGRRGWISLTAFVRATVLVALVDATGITVVALILGLPFAVPIGLLVFLMSFIPIVGALVSGAVAVLVALVAKGPFVAVLMLGGVLLVQQLEAHVLQPFLMGRFVRLHPVAVLLAIGAGAYLAGIIGALFAVPIVAVLNGVVRHLAQGDSGDEVGPTMSDRELSEVSRRSRRETSDN